MRKQLLIIGTSIIICISSINAKIIYVGPDESLKSIYMALYEVSAGDTIIVRNGMYPQTITLRTPMTLMAENPGMAFIGDGSSEGGIIRVRSDNVTIQGFTFSQNREWPGIIVGTLSDGVKASNCIIRNNMFQNRQSAVRTSPHSENCTIEANNINGSSDNGLVLAGKGSTVRMNRVANSGATGIFIGENGEGSTLITGNVVENNEGMGIYTESPNTIFTRNWIKDNNEAGIGLANHRQNFIISDSNIIENNQAGIFIENRALVHIEGNIIRGNRQIGIEIMDSASVKIWGNSISGNGETGINNQGLADIYGNVISGNQMNGIEIRELASQSRMEKNNISDNHHSGVLINDSHGEFFENTISGNGMFGIGLENSGPVKITRNNQILSNMEHGIFVSEGSTAIISGNRISENGKAVIEWEDFSGIFVFGTAIIKENEIINNHGSGVLLESSATNIIINDNLSISGNREGILIKSPGHIENNLISENNYQGVMVWNSGNILVKNNILVNNRRGIQINPEADSTRILNCKISHNNIGIVSDAHCKVRRTVIDSNLIGIRIREPGIEMGLANMEDGGYNTIRRNTTWNIQNNTGDTVYACYNYWDYQEIAKIDSTIQDDEEEALSAPVVISPFLVEDATGMDTGNSISGMSGNSLIVETFPNPCQGELSIRFSLKAPTKISMYVIDVRGRVVTNLIRNRSYTSGEHGLQWNSKHTSGGNLRDGIYFLVVKTGYGIDTKKILLRR